MSQSGARPVLIRLGLLLTSVIYALILTHPRGKRWADHQTWSTVVIGVGYTLGWLALEDQQASVKAREFFLWSCGPIIARSLALQLESITAIFREI